MNYKIILQLFLPLGLFMAISVIFKLFPPKKINSFYGYRTTRSVKSQQAWDFAQRYSAKKMIMAGLFNIAANAIFLYILLPAGCNQMEVSSYCAIFQSVLLIISILPIVVIPTERRLKKMENDKMRKFLETVSNATENQS